MAVDTLSRRALLEAKKNAGYAPRTKVWPPDGYVAPTAEEFAGLLRVARSHSSGATYRSTWERMDDATVLRRMQLAELARFHGREKTWVYDYTHALRQEASRRGLVHRSIAILRCESCHHATERLFEATQETHSGLSNRSDNPVDSAWFCARCWSGDDVAGEDETEDEG
jgi:hypothetical protein